MLIRIYIYGHQESGDIFQGTWQEDNGYDAHIKLYVKQEDGTVVGQVPK